MKRQEYLDLKQRHQREVEEFPIAYAFNGKQLKEAIAKLGATKQEVTTLGYGTVIKRSDIPALDELMENHRHELKMAMKDKDFAYEAFLYEMDNHEYAINFDGDAEVLSCFNLVYAQLEDLDLEEVYQRAARQHLKNAQEWGMV